MPSRRPPHWPAFRSSKAQVLWSVPEKQRTLLGPICEEECVVKTAPIPARARRSPSPWPAWVVLVVSASWISAVGNLPLWRTLSQSLADTPGGLYVLAGSFLLVSSATTVLVGCLSWGRTTAPVLILLAAIAGVIQYFMLEYGAVVDTDMLANALQTNYAELRDLMSWGLLGQVLLVSAVPIATTIFLATGVEASASRFRRQVRLIAVAIAVAVLLTGALYGRLAPVVRSDMRLRHMVNPITTLGSAVRLAARNMRAPAGPLVSLSKDARLGSSYESGNGRPPLLLIVIGETARADHFGINGYARDTTPLLRDLGVISFTDVTSCGTDTRDSLPCKFSALGRSRFLSRDRESENLLDVLQAAGLAVLWIDNQSGCKNVCDRVPRMTTADLPADRRSALCNEGECQDRALLEAMDIGLSKLPLERRRKGTVVVLHQMGSHGPAYFKRSPPDLKRFVPECTDKSLARCDRTSLVNAYDNTIVTTDDLLARSVAWLRTQESVAGAMLYLSDHGESLGERGVYLHGLPYAVAPKAQTHVPFIAWFSDAASVRTSLDISCVSSLSASPLSHDNFFHIVIGLLDVTVSAYSRSLDSFASCRRQ